MSVSHGLAVWGGPGVSVRVASTCSTRPRQSALIHAHLLALAPGLGSRTPVIAAPASVHRARQGLIPSPRPRKDMIGRMPERTGGSRRTRPDLRHLRRRPQQPRRRPVPAVWRHGHRPGPAHPDRDRGGVMTVDQRVTLAGEYLAGGACGTSTPAAVGAPRTACRGTIEDINTSRKCLNRT